MDQTLSKFKKSIEKVQQLYQNDSNEVDNEHKQFINKIKKQDKWDTDQLKCPQSTTSFQSKYLSIAVNTINVLSICHYLSLYLNFQSIFH